MQTTNSLHYLNAQAAYEEKNYERAHLALAQAIDETPDSIDCLNLLGSTYKAENKMQEALLAFEEALELDPHQSDTLNNLGVSLKELGRYEEAKVHLEFAIAQNPKHAVAINNHANLLRETGQLLEAIGQHQKAISLSRDYVDAHVDYALTLMRGRQIPAAWHEYEWRLKKPHYKQYFQYPRYQDAYATAASWYLSAEQGPGDQILFLSCLADFMKFHQSCTVSVDPRLIPMLQRSHPNAQFVAAHRAADALEHCDNVIQLPLGSLPLHTRGDLTSFPEKNHYMKPDTTAVFRWRKYLATLGPGLNIGISWRSSVKTLRRQLRCTSLREWQEVLQVPNIHFINLQPDECTIELDALQKEFGINLITPPDINLWEDFDETAALCIALDLVISPGTTTFELASAVGANVWLLAPQCGWALTPETIPWFPGLRVFQQQRLGHWEPTFSLIAKELREMLRQYF